LALNSALYLFRFLLMVISFLLGVTQSLALCPDFGDHRPLLVLDDPQHSGSEKRWAAFGKTDADRFLVVIFTKRDNFMRIISARNMNQREREFYDEKG